MQNIINIIGKGEGWEKAIGKPGINYGINDVFFQHSGIDITFHMHDLQKFYENEETHSSTKLCIEHAKDRPDMLFYSIYEWSKLPGCKEYPLDEIVREYGVCYFGSTVDYAIAYAIRENPDKINLYGINMSVREEYIEQKPSLEFWVGLAMGRGIKVGYQHKYSSMMKTKNGLLYGYLFNQWRTDGAID